MFHNHSCKAALLGVAGLISLSAAAAERPAQPTASVLVEPAVEIAESSTRTIPGRLEAIEEVSMVPRISGNINTIKFSEGDMVKKGQLLYELEDTTYRAPIRLTEKGYEAARPLDDIIHRVLDEAGGELALRQRMQMYDSLNHILEKLRTFGR